MLMPESLVCLEKGGRLELSVRGYVRSNHSGGKRQIHNSPGKSPGWVSSDANKIIVCKRLTPLSKWVNSVSEWPAQETELVVIQPALKAGFSDHLSNAFVHRCRGEPSASHRASDSERSPLSWSLLLLLIGAMMSLERLNEAHVQIMLLRF